MHFPHSLGVPWTDGRAHPAKPVLLHIASKGKREEVCGCPMSHVPCPVLVRSPPLWYTIINHRHESGSPPRAPRVPVYPHGDPRARTARVDALLSAALHWSTY